MILKYFKQLFDVPVEINKLTYLMLIGVALFFGIPHFFIMLGLLFFVFLHEHGHILAGRNYGISTHSIVITPLGGLAMMSSVGRTNKQKFVIAISGPAINFILAVLFGIFNNLLVFVCPIELLRTAFMSNIISAFNYIFFMNLVLGVFNLVPAYPLDGGRILGAILTALKVSNSLKRKIISYTSKVIAVLMIIYSLFSFNVFMFIIAIFIFVYSNKQSM